MASHGRHPVADLEALSEWADGLLATLSDGERAKLARIIAADLRRRQQARIAAQLNPNGTPFAPRKPQLRRKAGAIRRTMFTKLRTARFLKASGSAEGAVVEFSNQVQRIALVHHYGLRERASPQLEKEVRYPSRQLLGLSQQDSDFILEVVVSHLAR